MDDNCLSLRLEDTGLAKVQEATVTLEELFRAVDALSAEELQQLQERIKRRQCEIAASGGHTLDRALEALRDGLTDEQIDRLEWAMNVETTQPLDKSAWQG